MSAFVYIPLCADGSYYVGSARGESLDKRMGEHDGGEMGGYTATRRPVRLVYAEPFQFVTDAIAAERRIKGWSRAKKEALIRGDWERVRTLAKRPGARRETTSATNPPPLAEVLGEAEPRSMHDGRASFEGRFAATSG